MSTRSASPRRVAAASSLRANSGDWLADELADLVVACDATTTALERRDLPGLIAANERAEALMDRIRERATDLNDSDLSHADTDPARVLRERIDRATRRNAYLIERAWALDAATMRLLASLGRPAPDQATHPYAPPNGPGYLDRQA
jgi:hypothetical protein